MAVVIPRVVTPTSASGAQVIDGSLVFESTRSQHLNFTPSSNSNQKTYTWSGWVKFSDLTIAGCIFAGASGTLYYTQFKFFGIEGGTAGRYYKINFQNYDTNSSSSEFYDVYTTQVLRDTGWYHLVLSVDTTQDIAADRVKIYINGTECEKTDSAGTGAATYGDKDTNTHINRTTDEIEICSHPQYASDNPSVYMSQCYFIDGMTLGPGYFGYNDPLTNTWRPKAFRAEGTTINNGTVWSNGAFDARSGATPATAFNGNTDDYYQVNTDSDGGGVNFSPGLTGNLTVYVSTGQPNNGDSTQTVTLSDGTTHSTSQGYNNGAQIIDFGFVTNITSVSITNSGLFYAFELDGVLMIDSTTQNLDYGTNGYYLPFDGSESIGKDQSGKGNDWTPVNFGGSNVIPKATGALPILNTLSGGRVASPGVRTDASGNNCVLALPLVGNALDVSNQINSGSTTKTATVTAAAGITTDSNFYSGSYYFNGPTSGSSSATNYIVVADSNSEFAFGTGDFTMECWVWGNDWTTGDQVFLGHTGTNYAGFYINSSAYCYYADGASHFIPSSNKPTLQSKKWFHAAVSRQSGTTRVFLDGVLIGSDTDTDSHPTGSIEIGRNPGNGQNQFNGYIQDVRIYGSAKYTENFIPASTNPNIFPDTPSGVSLSSELTKVIDGSVAFDGTGDYLQLADSADFDMGTGDFTLECFVNSIDDSDYQGVFGSGDYDNDAVLLQIANTGVLRFTQPSGIDEWGSTDLQNSGWHHIVMCRSGTTLKGFVDGREEISATYSSSIDWGHSSNIIVIGTVDVTDYPGQYQYKGHISNLRLVKGTALYTSNFTPPTAPLTNVTNTKLLCCQSNTSAIAYEVSPGTITANGHAVANDFNPFTDNINTVMGQETGYATFNTLRYAGYTTSDRIFTDGNLRMLGRGDAVSNFGVKSGKFYAEVYVEKYDYPDQGYIGLLSQPQTYNERSWPSAKIVALRDNASGGDTLYGDGKTTTTTTWTHGDLLSVAFDADAAKVWIAKNGNWINGGNPATGGTPLFAGITFTDYYFLVSDNEPSSNPTTAGNIYQINFGQKPFKYAPPEGYKPLNYANLPSPGVLRPDQYVGITTYKGTDATLRVSGYKFNPDLVWVKKVDGSDNNNIIDSVRPLYMALETNFGRDATNYGVTGVTSLNRDGFTLGTDGGYNSSSYYYIGYCWKSGGNPGISTTAFWKDDKEYASASAAGLTGDSELFLQDEVYSSVLYGYSSAHGAQFQTGAEAVKAFNGTVGSAWNEGASPLGGGSDTYIRFTPSSQVATNTVSVYINHHMDVSFYTGSPGSETKVAGPFSTDVSAYFTKVDCGTVPAWDYVQMQVDEPASYSAYLGGIEIGGKLLVDSNVTPPGVPSLTPTSASVGTKQGFSIIKYRGNGTSGATIGHGLSQAPDFFVIKSTEYSYNWNVYHQAMGNTHLIRLNQDLAQVTESGAAWNDTSPTSSVITFGNLGGTNMNTAEYVGYIWHDVDGLQKFGSYEGSNTTDGTFVELGFRPSVVIFKNMDATEDWMIVDGTRNPYNPVISTLYPNEPDAQSNATNRCDFLSNGFKLQSGTSIPNTANTYIYAAWAHQPMDNMFGAQSNAR